MINKITVPGYYRVQPNLTKDSKQVVLLSLNGKTAISTILRSELCTDDSIITDFDGQLSIGQELSLEMSETGKVKASRVIKEDFNKESVLDFQDFGNETLDAIRRFDLAEHGGIIRVLGNLEDDIRKSGGRGYYTKSMIRMIQQKMPNLSVAEHIIWQYSMHDGKVQCQAFIPSSIERIRFYSENLFNSAYNSSTPHVFFKEYVGKEYQRGIKGHRVLVVGESVFCDKKACPFYEVCTNDSIKNSSAFENQCPYSDVPLSESVLYNVECFLNGTSEGEIKSYTNFTQLMEQIGAVSDRRIYDSIVFYDYLQFFSPKSSIKSEYLSERDDTAFEEIIHKHNPDIIIVWGTNVANRIKKKGRYPVRNIKGDYDMDYIFSQKIDGRWRTFFCIYHPSDRYGHLTQSWNTHVEQGKKIFG